jgi:hypothetical protein
VQVITINAKPDLFVEQGAKAWLDSLGGTGVAGKWVVSWIQGGRERKRKRKREKVTYPISTMSST